MYPFVHGRLSLLGPLHVQYLDQRLDGDALEEDGEVDDSYGGCHEHGLQGYHFLVDKEDEGEGYGTPEAAVRHHELLHLAQLVQTEAIGNRCQ